MFNEPLALFTSVTGLRFYSVVHAGIQGTYFAYLLHFWIYRLDTIVASDTRSDQSNLEIPKAILVFLLWLCITLQVIVLKLSEINFSNDLTAQVRRPFFSYLLTLLLGIYASYLAFLFVKAFRFLRYMKPNFKLVLFYTLIVIVIGVVLLSFHGV